MFKSRLARQIARLERAGNDDFLLILTGGAGAFPTHELHLLLRRVRIEERKHARLRRLMFKIGLAIPFLMFCACACSLLAWRTLTGVCLLTLPALLLTLALCQLRVRRRFRCLDRGERIRAIINQELERRRRGEISVYGF